ncbi:hypothetical protein BPO_1101 [Bergeyella porcorum]|uniref:Uncharacterized protein n=1 Tax=Bergeyella porcorum TaxID=1735111 RepID=A0AAU0F1T8_9FLAO
MTKKETAVIIDGKAIDLKEWLVTNQEKGLIETSFSNIQDLGNILNDIIGVCACALNSISDNEQLSDYEQAKVLGASPLNVANVLRFAQTLIPYTELELLTDIQKSILEK